MISKCTLPSCILALPSPLGRQAPPRLLNATQAGFLYLVVMLQTRRLRPRAAEGLTPGHTANVVSVVKKASESESFQLHVQCCAWNKHKFDKYRCGFSSCHGTVSCLCPGAAVRSHLVLSGDTLLLVTNLSGT